jgi:hypothetical protein
MDAKKKAVLIMSLNRFWLMVLIIVCLAQAHKIKSLKERPKVIYDLTPRISNVPRPGRVPNEKLAKAKEKDERPTTKR